MHWNKKSIIYLILIWVIAIGFVGCAKEEAEIIKVGAVLPLTGPGASYGESARNGIEIARAEINAAGGIKGKTIEVLYEDSQIQPKIAVAAMKKFVNIEKVPVVMGAVASGVTLAMAPVANETQTVLISPISTASEISDAGEYVFRIAPSDTFQGEILANWLYNAGHRNIGVLFVNNSWGVGLKGKLVAVFKDLGGTIASVESFKEEDRDFRTQLTKIKTSAPDAYLFFTYTKEGGLVLKQASELGIQGPFYGGDVWSSYEIIEAAGAAAEGIMFTVPEQYKGEEYQKFKADYVAKYEQEPDVNATQAYDTMKVVALAMGEAGLEPKAIKDELLRVKDYKGTTGIITFDENGDRIGMTFSKKMVKGGKIVPYSE